MRDAIFGQSIQLTSSLEIDVYIYFPNLFLCTAVCVEVILSLGLNG